MSYYIIQNMQKYLNIQHFEKDEDGMLRYLDDKITKPTFNELFDFKYSMVIAEPGYGKTRLLKEIVLKASEQNKKAFFIDSKKIKNNIVDSIQKCKEISNIISEENLQKESLFSNTLDFNLDENTIICLDALDELPFSKLYDFFEIIEKFIKAYPSVHLFISCRTHHLNKVDFNLSKLPFEYITLEHFYGDQITKYLSNKFTSDIVKEIEEKSNQTELFNFLSIPRYLYYFSELIEPMGIKEITKLSRAEMFENFIYRKLDKEKGRGVSHSQYDIIKRVLEKIAIVMKINQVSQISKDELFTIFEDINSNFSQIVFRDDLLNILYDKSIIKDNIDFIEFENQEFLDFLVAKEICRFDKVEQVFFDIAVEPYLQEIFTSWFYVLPFLLEQKPFMIKILLNFLKKNLDKALREKYFYALTYIETKNLDKELKSQIFTFVFDYHTQHNKWLHLSRLAYFYNENKHYQKMLDSIDESKNTDDELYVRRNNVVDIISLLVKDKKLTTKQVEFWKDKYIQWLKLDIVKNQVLHRNIISSLPMFAENDFEYIKSLYFIFKTGIEIQYSFARVCYITMPEDIFSIDVYFKTYKLYQKNKQTSSLSSSDGISYIFKLKTLNGISYSIEKLISDYGTDECQLHLLFRNLYDTYEDKLDKFAEHINTTFDTTNIDIIKKFTTILATKHFQDYDKEHYLKKILIADIFEKDKNYIFELIEFEYHRYKNNETNFWNMASLIKHDFIPYINNENFNIIYELLKKFEEGQWTLNSLMYELYTNNKIHSKIKEKIKTKYNDYITEVDKNILKRDAKYQRDTKNKFIGLCKQWEHKIEPEENQYRTDLFEFFISEKETLKNCKKYEENRLKTIEVAKEIIRLNNPLNNKVEVNGNTTTTWGVHDFGKCIEFLDNEYVLLDEKILIDNVFRYLPFNMNSDYKTIFKLAKNPSSKAIQDIVDVYAGTTRDDDLNISQPENFIQMYKNFNLKEAEPLLLKMLFNQDIREYKREQIVDVLPKTVLTQKKIKEYLKKYGKKNELYEKMLYTLIQTHNENSAFNTAFEIIIEKAKKADIPNSESSLHGTSLDFVYNKLVFAIINTNYSIEKDKELLLLSEKLEKKGKKLNARFLQDIVFKHVEYLKHKNSFEPIFEIEKFLQENRDKINLHWFEYKLNELKEIYLEELAKPANISASIKKYNELKEKDYLAISSPSHLLEIIQDTIENDLKHWIEDEGAYKDIEELAMKKTLQAEKFIQKTIKSQIELSLFQKGFRATDFIIKREEETLNGSRADFTISYGFIGSILIELKLANNDEAIATRKGGKNYIKTLNKYINGTNSDYGIFLIFNIRSSKEEFKDQIQKLSKLYEKEKTITVMEVNCKI